MRYDEIRQHMVQHFGAMLASKQAQIQERGRLSGSVVAQLEQAVANANASLSAGHRLIQDDYLGNFILKYGLKIEPGTPAYNMLDEELKRAYRDYCRKLLAFDHSMESFDFSDAGIAKPKGMSLKALTVAYAADKNASQAWTAKTKLEKSVHFDLLLEILTTKTDDVQRLTPTDAKLVKDTLLNYPKNRNKKFSTRGRSLRDAMAVVGYERIKVPTVNKHLQTYGELFRWGKANGHVDAILFDRVTLRQNHKTAATVRTAFSAEQVSALLRELLTNEHGLIREPFHKWGPLIGLYTGARLNEISQLRLDDISQIDGMWCIHVHEGSGQQLKNTFSKRYIPVHRSLIEHGLLEYVSILRAENAERLFPSFRYCPKNNWGRSLSRWFNAVFLPGLGLKVDALVFHSLRHTVSTRLLQADISEPIVQSIL